MKQFTIGLFLCLLQFNLSAQIQSSELGIEAFGGGSQLGGTLGGELKYAVKLPNNLIIGPSFRLHRSWSNYLNVNSQFNMYGGGAFAHLRYQDKVFAGVEFQMLHSPFNFITFQSGQKKWAPTLFVGGGFYLKLAPKINLNLALFILRSHEVYFNLHISLNYYYYLTSLYSVNNYLQLLDCKNY